MSTRRVGILGVGCFLPESIRTNDWWPAEVVKSWKSNESARLLRLQNAATNSSLEVRLAIEEEIALVGDPFAGSRERRVVEPGQTSVDLGLTAASAALERANISHSEIDLLLESCWNPVDLNAPNACLIHHRLELPRRCFVLSTQGSCNAFLQHLALAEKLISSGAARYGLLVHSSVASPLLKIDDRLSPICGDGAAAVVVGVVSEDRGILGHEHHADGRYFDVLRIGVPGGNWYDEAHDYYYSLDKDNALNMLINVGNHALETVLPALEKAGHCPQEVDAYFTHQGLLWLRRVTQKVIGIPDSAKTIDTFTEYGNLISANIPICIASAEHQGILEDGDLIAMHSGGSGITLSGMVMRWGK